MKTIMSKFLHWILALCKESNSEYKLIDTSSLTRTRELRGEPLEGENSQSKEKQS